MPRDFKKHEKKKIVRVCRLDEIDAFCQKLSDYIFRSALKFLLKDEIWKKFVNRIGIKKLEDFWIF